MWGWQDDVRPVLQSKFSIQRITSDHLALLSLTGDNWLSTTSVSSGFPTSHEGIDAKEAQLLWNFSGQRKGNTMQTDMLVNASSSSMYCMDVPTGLYMSIAFFTTKILLLPLSVLVLYLGHQRWRQQRSFSTSSHSDIFTYHMAATELIYAFGCTVTFCSIYSEVSEVGIVGVYLSSMAFPGQMGFHMLTCVERYLAVVHPVTYMGLRQSGGIKLRNISIGCVWLLSLVWSALSVHRVFLYVLHFCLLVFTLVVVSFCSLRVLCVLMRPGPGEVGRDRKQVDQSKQKAFHTIAAIKAVLWFSFVGCLACIAVDNSPLLRHTESCAILISGLWFTLPSSLVLPLLFLHRAGKLLN